MKRRLIFFLFSLTLIVASCRTSKSTGSGYIPRKMVPGDLYSFFKADSSGSTKYYQTLQADGELNSSGTENNTYADINSIPNVIVTNDNRSSYYIVSGSFRNYKNAISMGKELEKIGYKNVTYQSYNGLFRVLAEHFSNEDEARKFLNKFRISHAEFKDAWLLIVN